MVGGISVGAGTATGIDIGGVRGLIVTTAAVAVAVAVAILVLVILLVLVVVPVVVVVPASNGLAMGFEDGGR